MSLLVPEEGKSKAMRDIPMRVNLVLSTCEVKLC